MPTMPRRPQLPVTLRRRRSAPWIPDVDRSTAVVDCAVYRDGVRIDCAADWRAAARLAREQGGFVWIGLHEPSDRQLGEIGAEYGLHPLAVEDAVHAHQRPKLEQYDDMVFTVVKTVHYRDDDPDDGHGEVIETGEIMVFLGEDYVITVRHGEHGGLAGMRRSLEHDSSLLSLGPSVVLHGIVDRVVDEYLAVAQALTADVDDLEAGVFTSSSRLASTDAMYQLKREVLALRRAAVPLTIPLQQLTEEGRIPQVPGDISEYFRDVADHLTQVVDQVASSDDLLNTLVQANLARISVQQNSDMRKISAWVAIAAIPTMIAGLYGMNVPLPGRDDWWSYIVIVVALVIACAWLYRAFRRNGWL
ncbi:magnesium and cobalt transport protein CorA [Jatrophihabitans sp. YIM 134969]